MPKHEEFLCAGCGRAAVASPRSASDQPFCDECGPVSDCETCGDLGLVRPAVIEVNVAERGFVCMCAVHYTAYLAILDDNMRTSIIEVRG